VRSFQGSIFQLQGYAGRGLKQSRSALTLSRKLASRYTSALALHWACLFHQVRWEPRRVAELAAALLPLATEHSFPHLVGTGTFFRGWAWAADGVFADGIEEMRRGLAAKRATGAEIKVPYYQGLLAATHTNIGRPREALALLDEALGTAARTGEGWFEAELHRLRGEALLRLPRADIAGAETSFYRAIKLARAQGAKWWELRAARSVARLWAQRGERQRAHDLLAPVYGWFTEGFDMPDLIEAEALLEALD